jgi:diguanylate cyclase (GGDEF)-like protein
VDVGITMDHGPLDRIARQMGLTIGFIGLLATAVVVEVSRRSEVSLRQLNLKLLEESRSDGLTRVANRRAWDEALNLEEKRRQRYGQRYGLVVVDLDGFKQINDAQGHPQGDAVLLQAAQQLRNHVRDGDLVARVGGDEFALLVFPTDADGLEDLVVRLRRSFLADGIQASIGAALSDDHTPLHQVWGKADAAMYANKVGPSARANVPLHHGVLQAAD